jgi:peptide chain release factor 2
VQIDNSIADLKDWVAMYRELPAEDILLSLQHEAQQLTLIVEKLEFRRMFSKPYSINNAYLDIQSGSGGTEAQDWAQMIFRMYLRWADSHGFTTSIIEESPGDVVGIKSAIKIEGDYAFGWLRTETGVHRLVRKSPFDANSKRHTSFASIFVSPEIDDDIQIEINPADLRVDTYRASGAGGQHVNKTDSAVRITHLPTNTVVQCQNDRSQHKNRAQAMSQLKAKLYELEMQSKNAERQLLEDAKSDIGWGSQIRSYVLDGNLDAFIIASLQQGL